MINLCRTTLILFLALLVFATGVTHTAQGPLPASLALGVPAAEAASEAPDAGVALLLSLVIPGILQILFSGSPETGIIYFLVALLGFVLLNIVIPGSIGWLFGLIFYFVIGWYAWTQWGGGGGRRLGLRNKAQPRSWSASPLAPRFTIDGVLLPIH